MDWLSKRGTTQDQNGQAFFHRDGHFAASDRLGELLRSGTESVRGAVCFVTKPGADFLLRHARTLSGQGSFFVASVEFPTDIDAMKRLYAKAPGNIYIHLGGTTPQATDIKKARSLMHSKLLLARRESGSRLWVGSHNMTAAAIAGANIEAGIEIRSSKPSPTIDAAASHLEYCRATAEPFDPRQVERYRAIQDKRRGTPDPFEPAKWLVIHAESDLEVDSLRFTIHSQIGPTIFDKYFVTDRKVRLYLYPLDSLARAQPVADRAMSFWKGSITGVVRTARHPRNRGVTGSFSSADYDLAIPDMHTPPRLVRPGTIRVDATSQLIIRIDQQGTIGEEVYSMAARPFSYRLVTDPESQQWHEVPHDFAADFTEGSISQGRFVYRRVTDLHQLIHIEGYEETLRRLPDHGRGLDIGSPDYAAKAAPHTAPVRAFFHLTKHVIRIPADKRS